MKKYKSTSLAKDILQSETTIDVIFLDIQMTNEICIEFLKKNVKPKVFFTTASSEYALGSYDFQVIDYILKPINEERFDKAIQNFKTTWK